MAFFPKYNTTAFWRNGEALQVTIDFMTYTGDHAFQSIVEDIYKVRPWYALELLADGSWDDSCWWVLAYIGAHNLFGSAAPYDYIGDARKLFDHVWESAYSTDACGGGVWWSSKNAYKNAITNELVMAAAARLYLANQGDKYLDIATSMWSWFEKLGNDECQG